MVTGGAASSVLYNLIRTNGSGRLVDYDIALLFQPCLLLGVSNLFQRELQWQLHQRQPSCGCPNCYSSWALSDHS
jgi:hypothetical protein